MDVVVLRTLAMKELRDSLRNRWFVLYTAAFTTLTLALGYLSLAGVGTAGFGGFGRTAAGLINLVLFIVPLMALTTGAGALAGERERGTLQMLLAQPVTKTEVLLGKYLGLALALFASLAIGFGASAAVMAWRGGSTDAGAYFVLVLLAFALALAMLSAGFLISALSPRPAVAIGVAVFVWLALLLAGDLGLMGGVFVFKLQAGELFGLSLASPLQVFKMAAVRSINASLDVLGPAGIYAMQTWGGRLSLVFFGAMSAWVVAPLAAALLVFWRRSSV